MGNNLLICRSESGDYYYYTCNKRPTEKEFDEFVKENIPNEYEDGYNYLMIEKCIDLKNIKNINF